MKPRPGFLKARLLERGVRHSVNGDEEAEAHVTSVAKDERAFDLAGKLKAHMGEDGSGKITFSWQVAG